MTKKKRTTFSPEFKREAVRLLEQGDKVTNKGQIYLKAQPLWLSFVVSSDGYL